MGMKLKTEFTGICSILKEHRRILLPNAGKAHLNCEKTEEIHPHVAYLKYRLADRVGSTPPPDKMSARYKEGIFFLKGVSVVLIGPKIDKKLTYPDGREHLEGVAAMGRIYPGYRLRTQYLADPMHLNPDDVAAHFLLDVGNFRRPKFDPLKKWHFHPQRQAPVRGGLAQVAALHVNFENDSCVIGLVPFGQRDASVVLVLKNDSGEVPIQIGNTPEEDIFPEDPNKEPPLGPDYHFEIYYRLTEPADDDCFPVPYYEGKRPAAGPSSGHAHGASMERRGDVTLAGTFAAGRPVGGSSISLGGANCPPNQWP